MAIRYAELFAGVGGFREGIQQAEYVARNKKQQRDATSGDDPGCWDTEATESGQSEKWRNNNYQFECVYASELDKYASAVYRHVWGNNGEPCPELHEGDIREQKTEEVPDFDFLTAGFPCQSFSVAGQRLGFQDTRGTLFFEVARFLADKRPRHFLLENVKGLLSHEDGKTFQTILGILSDLGYRYEWEMVNSTCWVPQNRERVFIIGHLRGECGRTVFPLREDDGRTDEGIRKAPDVRCLNGGGHSGGHHSQMTCVVERPHGYNQGGVKSGVHLRGEGHSDQNQFIGIPTTKMEGGGFCDNRICGDTAPTLMGCANTGGNHQSGISHRNPIVIHENKSGTQTPHDEAVALRSGASHNYQKVALPDACMSLDQDGYLRLTGARPRDENGKPQLLPIGYRRFRRLTPLECERLQGWPDLHTAIGLYRATDLPKSKRNRDEYVLDLVSDTQRYRMTGNGVTADCVREIVKKMLQTGCFDD